MESVIGKHLLLVPQNVILQRPGRNASTVDEDKKTLNFKKGECKHSVVEAVGLLLLYKRDINKFIPSTKPGLDYNQLLLW